MKSVSPLDQQSPIDNTELQSAKSALAATLSSLNSVLLGKPEQLKLALCCLLSNGHLLIEDLPGMGKTTLSQALAKVMGLDFQRLQFTSDMLPSDVIGSSVYNKQDQSFSFIKGPVFTQLLLADEINRTTPKTQSALLEAMEEGQVSIDRNTYELPQPFFVIATQNPSSQGGTYPLPESQLDRFLMRLSLGYPNAEAERKILEGDSGRTKLESLKSELDPERLVALQAQVSRVKASAALLDYLQRLIEFSRVESEVGYGLSPRAALGLLQAAKASAFVEGRSHVIPEDVQAVLMSVVAHRLDGGAGFNSNGAALVNKMLETVPVIL